MKSMFRKLAATLSTTAVIGMGAVSSIAPAIAAPSQFGQQDVDQSKFIAVASPYQNGNAHQLLILEQVASTRQCWGETPGQPTVVSPLLLGFDFTGICSRSTDSNGYSVRINGEDFGMTYSLRIVRKDGDMLLVGVPRNRGEQTILIGRAGGMTTDFAKITLEPGWVFTKRTFENRTLGHVYLTHDGATPIATVTGVSGGGGTTPLVRPVTSTPVATNLTDINNDIYRNEIAMAVNAGFIKGFENNTYGPTQPVTREQLVSIVIGAIDSIPNVTLNLPTQVAAKPYADVETSRWSAAKIQFAKDNGIITGYADGTFGPSRSVSRAELIAVLRRAGEYALKVQGKAPQLTANRPAQAFADINTHWSKDVVTQMSTVCSVASPLNEAGTNFMPDTAAQRNYAAAATVRLLGCVGGTPQTAARPQ
jgi:N-acetylmuramoyl-L-alanine amidase